MRCMELPLQLQGNDLCMYVICIYLFINMRGSILPILQMSSPFPEWPKKNTTAKDENRRDYNFHQKQCFCTWKDINTKTIMMLLVVQWPTFLWIIFFFLLNDRGVCYWYSRSGEVLNMLHVGGPRPTDERAWMHKLYSVLSCRPWILRDLL